MKMAYGEYSLTQISEKYSENRILLIIMQHIATLALQPICRCVSKHSKKYFLPCFRMRPGLAPYKSDKITDGYKSNKNLPYFCNATKRPTVTFIPQVDLSVRRRLIVIVTKHQAYQV